MEPHFLLRFAPHKQWINGLMSTIVIMYIDKSTTKPNLRSAIGMFVGISVMLFVRRNVRYNALKISLTSLF